MGKRNYDFAGWVTKNDVRCSDGVTIKHDAFKDNDGQQVPLVWNHDYNSPNNVLGHVLLQNEKDGVYGFGFFNETNDAQNAKALVKHGDISSMSIGARKLKRSGDNVISGSIYEVSLVLAGANPGAMIDSVMQHSENGAEEERGIIHTGTLIHAADDIIEHKASKPSDAVKKAAKVVTDATSDTGDDAGEDDSQDPTIEDVINTMTDVQKSAVYALLSLVDGDADEANEDESAEDDSTKKAEGDTTKTDDAKKAAKKDATMKQNEDTDKEDTLKHNHKGDDETMKHNVFNQGDTNSRSNQEALKHSFNEVLKQAQRDKASSLKDMLANAEVKNSQGEVLTHGINSIEMLFPQAFETTNGNIPILYKDPNTAFNQILDATNKSPFSRVRTMVADLTEDEARAKGYNKGNMNKEEYFSLVKRQTTPTTVYKKQKLDRDDIIDIIDFDVVAFMNVEMQIMLKEEVARALMVGDGRDFSSQDKINEQNIRPIVGDNEFFTIHKKFADATDFITVVISSMSEYRGSGNPTLYIEPALLAQIKLLKDNQGRFLFGDIPSNDAIAARLGLSGIVVTTFLEGLGALIVNLRDYTLGASKGGQITNFDFFDIDFNQYKYLIETRLSGSLTMPKSAIHLMPGATAKTGANDSDAGMTYGQRQADKTTTTTTSI
jgi:HK97 family phage prohead protease